jgi:phosphohistidine phosphatase
MTLRWPTLRRLLLLRHAKSAWPEGVPDFDRPLAPRGRKAAKRIGGYLTVERLAPDLALVSPARRARETWDRVRSHLGLIGERSEARLYEASAGSLLAIVRETEPEVGALLIVGHNPGLEELAKLLAGSGSDKARARLMRKYPTASLAVLDFDVETWREVEVGLGRLSRFITPRSLKSGSR